MMSLHNRYRTQKCPHCSVEYITIWKKIGLIDYRVSHKCDHCGKNIQLPGWHVILLMIEIPTALILSAFGGLNTLQIILVYCIFIAIEIGVQLPFATVQEG